MLSIHGVLVRIADVGVLIIGEAESGKSSLALELIDRGHQLVADDVVEVTSTGNIAIGTAPVLLKGALEVRGLGILDVVKLFGENAVAGSSQIDMCFELLIDPVESADSEDMVLLDSRIPKWAISASDPRNRKIFIETAVKLFNDPGIKHGISIDRSIR